MSVPVGVFGLVTLYVIMRDVSHGSMTDELEKIWKEVVMNQLTFDPSICLEELSKAMKTPHRLALSWTRF
jgi:hypothetical protein